MVWEQGWLQLQGDAQPWQGIRHKPLHVGIFSPSGLSDGAAPWSSSLETWEGLWAVQMLQVQPFLG